MQLTTAQEKAVKIITERYKQGEKYTVMCGGAGMGKAIPNSALLPTPNGYKRVEEIKVGDKLYDRLGQPTKVIGVYPQGKKEVWQVTFKDGRKAKCCKDHLWSFYTQKTLHNSHNLQTHSLEWLSNKELKSSTSKGFKFSIPINKAVTKNAQKYYIPPYVFGLFLGDGSFRCNKYKIFYYSSEDNVLPNKIGKIMGWEVKKNSDYNYTYTFAWREQKDHKRVQVQEVLKEFPDLINTYSHEKYIPKEYLEGSIQQRFDLLNGLLDTDGSVDYKGRVSYSTVSEQLKNDILELTRSLGFCPTWRKDEREGRRVCYEIRIMCRPEDKVKLFTLPRKHQKIEDWYNNNKVKQCHESNHIVSIDNLHYQEEMTCFMVDNEEHLFLMNDYIVTHNTVTIKYAIESLINNTDIKEKDVVFTSYTGKATQVLFNYGNDNVMTLHKLMYFTHVDNKGRYYHQLKSSLGYKVVVVDEISMLSNKMVETLLSFPCYFIFSGDPFQLPSVEDGKDNMLFSHVHIFLSEVLRQAKESGIIRLATQIREMKPVKYQESRDVLVIAKEKLDMKMFNWADQILCSTNRLRKSINNKMKNEIWDDLPAENSKVVCLKNYWDIKSSKGQPLINGSVGYIKNIHAGYRCLRGRTASQSYTVNTVDCNFFIDDKNKFSNLSLSQDCFKTEEECVPKEVLTYATKVKRGKKMIPQKLPLMFTYGYCLSVHKSQGSQWDKVVVIEESFPQERVEHYRSLYTAVTRAKEKIILGR